MLCEIKPCAWAAVNFAEDHIGKENDQGHPKNHKECGACKIITKGAIKTNDRVGDEEGHQGDQGDAAMGRACRRMEVGTVGGA